LRISRLKRELEDELSTVSPSPSAEAAFILKELELVDPTGSVDEETHRRIREVVTKRVVDRIPLQYQFSRSYFMDLVLCVEEGIFIPRPETELLVETASELFPAGVFPGRILDVGTGTGAIALSLCRRFPDSLVVASDVSEQALLMARRNARLNDMRNEPMLVHGRGLRPFLGEIGFDLIVSNPPYVRRSEGPGLPPEVLREPEVALFSGEDGLDLSRELIVDGTRCLNPGGHLLLEIHPESLGALLELAKANGYAARVRKDYSGYDRVMVLKRR
jgi:release factor glutamine methyltransferase